MSTVFLTGATGHLGTNIARELLRRNHKVVALVRKTSNLFPLERLNIETRIGDIQDLDSITRAAEGCDAVIHSAADYSMWAKNDENTINSCVKGTGHVLQAAHRLGIKRIVYTSSTAAVGGSKDRHQILDENFWTEGASTAYYTGKTEAEHLAHRVARELGLELIVLNPSYIMGPYDYRPTSTQQIFVQILDGSGFTFDVSWGYVHVEDAARLHVDSLTMGEPGERYIVNSKSAHFGEIAKIVEEMFAIKMPSINLPRPVWLTLGYLQWMTSKITGKPPMFDHRVYKDVMVNHFNHDNTKSRETFGIEYKPLETIFRDTAAWLIHKGMVKEETRDRLRDQYPPHPDWV